MEGEDQGERERERGNVRERERARVGERGRYGREEGREIRDGENLGRERD